MSVKRYVVRLSIQERLACEQAVDRLRGGSQKAKRANILLRADADADNWTDTRIAESVRCRVGTVEEVRKRLCEEGFERALEGKKRALPPVPKKLDGGQEAKLIAMRLGQPPKGFGGWTLRLLADQMVALDVCDPGQTVSHELVRRTLKKTA